MILKNQLICWRNRHPGGNREQRAAITVLHAEVGQDRAELAAGVSRSDDTDPVRQGAQARRSS
jgi:hypothetical protein